MERREILMPAPDTDHEDTTLSETSQQQTENAAWSHCWEVPTADSQRRKVPAGPRWGVTGVRASFGTVRSPGDRLLGAVSMWTATDLHTYDDDDGVKCCAV